MADDITRPRPGSLAMDTALQTALGRHEALASSPTIYRMENWGHHRQSAVAIHQAIVDNFIASIETAPKELVLDFDATDDPIHCQQEKGFFHGYYGHKIGTDFDTSKPGQTE